MSSTHWPAANPSTLKMAFIPLPGGATAVYNSTGLAYYRHSDWLGSSRLASTPSRTVYSETAYAPFGEPYGWPNTSARPRRIRDGPRQNDSQAGKPEAAGVAIHPNG